MTASDYAAWYGAIVATGSLVISVVVIWIDTSKLYVTLTPKMQLTESRGDYTTDRTYCVIVVSNRGRRPSAVNKVWFTQKQEDKQLLVIDSFRAGTVDLPDGKSVQYMSRDDDYDITNLKEVMVEDGTGRVWFADVKLKTPLKLKLKRR